MRDRVLYAQILGIAHPWHESAVHLDVPAGEVEVVVEHRSEGCCPACGKPCPGLPLASSALAPPGHVPAADAAGDGRAAGEAPRARCGAGLDAVVGAGIPFHGAARARGDRMAQGSELQRGGTTVPPIVGRRGRDHGACGGPWPCAAQRAVAASDRARRNVVPEVPRVRDGGDGLGWPPCALGAQWPDERVGGCALRLDSRIRTRVGRGGSDGHVAPVHRRYGEVASERAGVL